MVGGDEALRAARVVRAPVGALDRPGALPALGSPIELFPWRYYFVSDARSHFDMSADGERFLVITAADEENDAEREAGHLYRHRLTIAIGR